jgi:XTP/dITP diphosphohydrolase
MKILIATHNKGKIREFSRILIPIGIEPIEMEIPEVEETGNSFKENAYLKAKSACKFSQLPSLADDSGLCIDALGGEPGIYSARYADEKNKIPLILQKMENVPVEKRTAILNAVFVVVFLQVK